MLEARLAQSNLLKRIVEAIRELVNDARFDCDDNGISLQVMDQSHVALVMFSLRQEAFESYRCDRNIPLGINLTSLSKILKCAGNDDTITLRAEDSGDTMGLVFESPSNANLNFVTRMCD